MTGGITASFGKPLTHHRSKQLGLLLVVTLIFHRDPSPTRREFVPAMMKIDEHSSTPMRRNDSGGERAKVAPQFR